MLKLLNSADEEIETIAKLVLDNHQSADDDEVIAVKTCIKRSPHLIQVRIPTYGNEDQVKERNIYPPPFWP